MAAFVQVSIDGVSVNLIPKTATPITQDIIVTSPGKIREDAGNLSQEFTFARTPDIAAVFDYWGVPGATEVPGLFDIIGGAQLRNQVETLAFGALQLNSVTLEGDFVCSFTDQTISFAKSLAQDGKTIANLPSDGLIVNYSIENVARSWVIDGGLRAEASTACGTWTLEGDDVSIVFWSYEDCDGNEQYTATPPGTGPRVVEGNNTTPWATILEDGWNVNSDFPPPVFTPATGVSTDAVTGVGPIENGIVSFPLVDFGTDGRIEPEAFGFIASTSSTIFDGDTVAGSWANEDTPAQVQQFSPSVSTTEIIDRIFSEENSTYASSFINTFGAGLHALVKTKEGLGVQTAATREGVRRNGFSTGIHTEIFTYGIHGQNSRSGKNQRRAIQRLGSGLPLGDSFTIAVSGNNFSWPEPLQNMSTDGRSVVLAAGTYEATASFRVTDIDTSDFSSRHWQQWRWHLRPLDAAGNIITGYDTEGFISERWGRGDIKWLDETQTVTLTAELPVGGGFEFVIYSDYRRGNSNLFITMDSFIFASTQEPESWDGIQVNPLLQFDPELSRNEFLLAYYQKFNLKYWPDKRRASHFFIEHYNDWLNAGPTPTWNDKVAGPIGRTSILDEVPAVIDFVDAESDDVLSVISRDTFPRREIGSSTFLSPSTKSTEEEIVGDVLEPLTTARISGQDPNAIELGNDSIPHIYELNSGKKESNRFGVRFGWITPTMPLPVQGYLTRVSEDPRSLDVLYYKTISPFKTLEVQGEEVTISTLFDLSSDYGMTIEPGARSAEDFFYSDYRNNLYREDNEIMRVQLRFTEEEFKSLEENSKPYIDGQRWIIRSIKNFVLDGGEVLVDGEFSKFYDNHDSLTESIAQQQFEVSGAASADIGGGENNASFTVTVPTGHEVMITSATADVSVNNILGVAQISFDRNDDASRSIEIDFTDITTGQVIKRTLVQGTVDTSARSTALTLVPTGFNNATFSPPFIILESNGTGEFTFTADDGYDFTAITQATVTGGQGAGVITSALVLNVDGTITVPVSIGTVIQFNSVLVVSADPVRETVTTPTIVINETLQDCTITPALDADQILDLVAGVTLESAYIIVPDNGFEFRTPNATIADVPTGFLIGQRLVSGTIHIDIMPPADILMSTNSFTFVATASAVPNTGLVTSVDVVGGATINQNTGDVVITVDSGSGSIGSIQNQHTAITESDFLRIWTGTESAFQLLVAAGNIQDDIIYHKRRG